MKLVYFFLLLTLVSSCKNGGDSTMKKQNSSEKVENTIEEEAKLQHNKQSENKQTSIDDTLSRSVKKAKTKKSSSNPVSSDRYYCFINGDKIPFKPPLDLFYIEFNYNPEMIALTNTERDKLNVQFEKDLKELGLVRLHPRRNVYRMVNSNYTRTQLVKKLLHKKEVHLLEAIYSTSGNERYFSSEIIIEFKEEMTIEQAKKIMKDQHLSNFTLYFNETHQLIGDLSFEPEEMLSYEFLIIANRLSELKSVHKVITTNIQHALPD